MGGAVISEVAERIPEFIQTLVYVAAHLLRDGESVLQAARTDPDTRLRPHLRFDETAGTITVAPEGFAAALLTGCSEADIARAMERTRPTALAPLATPVRITEARFGRVRRAYIQTTADHALCPGLQRRMLEATPCAPVLRIDTGHAPFFQAPEALARLLVQAGC
jgi:pimeloyl-ACP methyl ester carboxylesterase